MVPATDGSPKTPIMNVPHGDNSLAPKGLNLHQFIGCNVNGMPMEQKYAKVKEIGEGMVEHQADFGGFTEAQKNFSLKEVRHRVHGHFRPYFKHSKMVVSSAEPVEGYGDKEYLPGGTCSIIGGGLVGRVCAIHMDDNLGRWSCVTFKGKKNRHFTVITAYQVNADDIARAKARSTYKQQFRILKKHHSDPDPRMRFWKDIEILVGRYTAKKLEVLVMLDANDPKAKELGPIMNRKKLKELYTFRHGPLNEPETHICGSQRIDFMFGTAGVQQSMRKCGFGAYADFCFTDHRHMFVDLDLGELLCGHPPELSERERRILVTQNPRYKAEYKKKLEEFVMDNNILERQRKVHIDIERAHRVTANLQQELEEIDTLLTVGRLRAERLCGKLNLAPWSPKLKEARKIQRHWDLWKRQHLTNRDYSLKRAMMQAEISLEDPSSPTLVQAIKLLRAARQSVRDIMKEAKKHWEEFLKDRAADHRLAGRVPAAKIVDMIRKMEYNTRCFAHLRRIRGKNKSSGLQFIMIPDPDDPETDPSKK
jgi:hypothetical protein